MPVELRSGEFLYKKVGIFGSARAKRRYFGSNLGVEPGTLKYASFSPLDKANFEPYIVILVCSAKEGMRTVETSAMSRAKRPRANQVPFVPQFWRFLI